MEIKGVYWVLVWWWESWEKTKYLRVGSGNGIKSDLEFQSGQVLNEVDQHVVVVELLCQLCCQLGLGLLVSRPI